MKTAFVDPALTLLPELSGVPGVAISLGLQFSSMSWILVIVACMVGIIKRFNLTPRKRDSAEAEPEAETESADYIFACSMLSFPLILADTLFVIYFLRV